MSEVGDVIATALDILNDGHGWCRHELLDSRGKRCAIGAVNAALGLYEIDFYPRHSDWANAMAALRDHVPSDWQSRAWHRVDEGEFINDPHRDSYIVAVYNNSRSNFQEIKTWFEKTALDEGVTL